MTALQAGFSRSREPSGTAVPAPAGWLERKIPRSSNCVKFPLSGSARRTYLILRTSPISFIAGRSSTTNIYFQG